MDVEGAEFEILRSFLTAGGLCLIDHFMLELHSAELYNTAHPDQIQAPYNLANLIQWVTDASVCSTKLYIW